MKYAWVASGILFLGTFGCDQGNGSGSSGSGGSGSSVHASGGSLGSGSSQPSGGSIFSSSASSGGRSPGGSSANPGSSTGGNSSGGNTPLGGASSGSTPSGGGGTGGRSATGGTSTKTGGTTGAGGTTGPDGTRSGGSTSSGGAGSSGVIGGSVGSTSTGGNAGGSNTGGGTGTSSEGTGGSTGGLPALKVKDTKLQDPSGKTIILRGSSLIDIGALYAYNGNSIKGLTDRMDKLAAAGVQGHVVRFPVYPKIDYNAGYPTCSDLPYPVGSGPTTSCTPKSPMSAADYVSKLLKPAVDYATSKSLYVIIDHHQIDDITKGSSAADAKVFWTDIAPKFAGYSNVLYEPFNEPIDMTATWAQLKPVVQGLVDTIRAGGAKNIIIVPSHSYCQKPGDAASDPPSDPQGNLMYTAHIYPGNWNASFKQQVATAVTKAPVFLTEWGYILNNSDKTVGTQSATWGTELQTLIDGNGASWTAWVTDNQWTPTMFSDTAMTQLTHFGQLVKTWLAAKANSDWVTP